MNIPEITSVQTVNVKKNDVIFVRAPFNDMAPTMLKRHTDLMMARLKDIFPDNKIVMMDSSTNVTIVSSDDSEA
jgi:hypothetical protein